MLTTFTDMMVFETNPSVVFIEGSVSPFANRYKHHFKALFGNLFRCPHWSHKLRWLRRRGFPPKQLEFCVVSLIGCLCSVGVWGYFEGGGHNYMYFMLNSAYSPFSTRNKFKFKINLGETQGVLVGLVEVIKTKNYQYGLFEVNGHTAFRNIAFVTTKRTNSGPAKIDQRFITTFAQ